MLFEKGQEYRRSGGLEPLVPGVDGLVRKPLRAQRVSQADVGRNEPGVVSDQLAQRVGRLFGLARR